MFSRTCQPWHTYSYIHATYTQECMYVCHGIHTLTYNVYVCHGIHTLTHMLHTSYFVYGVYKVIVCMYVCMYVCHTCIMHDIHKVRGCMPYELLHTQVRGLRGTLTHTTPLHTQHLIPLYTQHLLPLLVCHTHK